MTVLGCHHCFPADRTRPCTARHLGLFFQWLGDPCASGYFRALLGFATFTPLEKRYAVSTTSSTSRPQVPHAPHAPQVLEVISSLGMDTGQHICRSHNLDREWRKNRYGDEMLQFQCSILASRDQVARQTSYSSALLGHMSISAAAGRIDPRLAPCTHPADNLE